MHAYLAGLGTTLSLIVTIVNAPVQSVLRNRLRNSNMYDMNCQYLLLYLKKLFFWSVFIQKIHDLTPKQDAASPLAPMLPSGYAGRRGAPAGWRSGQLGNGSAVPHRLKRGEQEAGCSQVMCAAGPGLCPVACAGNLFQSFRADAFAQLTL